MPVPQPDPLHVGYHRSPLREASPIAISAEGRFQHLHVIGQTGTGKSHLLKHLFLQDVHAGEGCCFIDPHGVDAAELLDMIPPHRMRDVVYFNPADTAHPIGFNVLHGVSREAHDRATNFIVAALRALWSESWGARMEDILKNAIRALLEHPTEVSFLGLNRMLVDPRYRAWIARHISNPQTASFWRDEFEVWSPRQKSEYTQPVLNKARQFVASDTLRNIIGQSRSTISLPFMMDKRRILIVNLDKGQLGADDANLLGSLIVTAFQFHAMQRDPAAPLAAYFLYIDEFQSFTTHAFATGLSELRKYRLGFTLAHQFLGQLEPPVRTALFGNAGTFIAFRVGTEDAEIVAKRVDYPEHFVSDLSDHEFAIRTKDDRDSATYYGRTVPLTHPRYGKGDRLIQYTRQRFTAPRKVAEERQRRWFDNPRF